MAIEGSRKNADAASRLRSSYQPCAASTSRSAAGWNSTSIQARDEALPNLLPRDRLDRTSFDVGHTSLDLGGPCLFHVGVGFTLERLDKQAGQVGAVLLRQLRRFLPNGLERPT